MSWTMESNASKKSNIANITSVILKATQWKLVIWRGDGFQGSIDLPMEEFFDYLVSANLSE